MDIIKIINEEILAQNDDIIQQYIDVIDLDPNNPKYDKYKTILKNDYNVDYINPEIRNRDEIKTINSLSNIKYKTKTNKGLDIEIISNKTPNLLTSLTLIAKHNNTVVGNLGFNINLSDKTIRIGGAKVDDAFTRQGIYSELITFVENVAKQYGLKLIETGRSDDAQKFWNNRNINELEQPDNHLNVVRLFHRVGAKFADNYPALIKSVMQQGLIPRDNGEAGEVIWFSDNIKDYGVNGEFVVAIDFNTDTNGVTNNEYGMVYNSGSAFAHNVIPFNKLIVVKIPVGQLKSGNRIISNLDAIKYSTQNTFFTPDKLNTGELKLTIYKDMFNEYVQPYIRKQNFIPELNPEVINIINVL